MNTEHFIARRILSGKGSEIRFSRPIIRISILGIVLGLAVMILTVAIVTGFQGQIQEKVIGFGSHIQVSKFDNNESYEPTPIDKRQDFIQLVKAMPEVKHIQTYAIKAGIMKANNEMDGIVLKGIDENFDWSFFSQNLKEGNIFSVRTGKRTRAILVSRVLAGRLQLHVGDSVPVYFIQDQKQRVKKFGVAGIYETGLGGQFDDVMVLGDLAYVQDMNGWDTSQVGGFEITLSDFRKLERVTEEVNGVIGFDLRAFSIKEIHRTVFSWLGAQDVNAKFIVILMLGVCCINMVSALLILILERTQMIGILKSLGSSDWSIRKIFVINAGYLVGLGMLGGNLLGLGIALGQNKFGWFKLDPASYFLSAVPMNIDITHILILNAATLIICILVLIVPTYLVTRISPVRAIRFT